MLIDIGPDGSIQLLNFERRILVSDAFPILIEDLKSIKIKIVFVAQSSDKSTEAWLRRKA